MADATGRTMSWFASFNVSDDSAIVADDRDPPTSPSSVPYRLDDPRTKQIIWRDVLFLILGFFATSIIGFVETHAADDDARIDVKIAGVVFGTSMFSTASRNPSGIIDSGYLLTSPLHEWLRDRRLWNDVLAGINSLACVILPAAYMTYVTVWRGDYSLSFRVLFVQLLRSFCGWFTYLPPDPAYLPSNYDFPDFVHCVLPGANCGEGGAPEAAPFVSFFSGHVATTVICANHLWLHHHRRSAVIMHLLNAFQIVRLLATRGHYSIDMIIGWCVAVYVSNPAGRLGRHYSRGMDHVRDLVPKTPAAAFECVTGINDAKKEMQVSKLLRRGDVRDMMERIGREEEAASAARRTSGGGSADLLRSASNTDTTVRILHDHASRLVQEQLSMVEEQAQYLQDNMTAQAHAVRERMEAKARELQSHVQDMQTAMMAQRRSFGWEREGDGVQQIMTPGQTGDADHTKRE